MIQRIQTVYLLFVFCLMAALMIFHMEMLKGFDLGYFGVCAVVALVTIFLYKKRNMQVRFCSIMLAAQGLFYVIFFFVFYWKYHLPLSEFSKHVGITFVFPMIAIILLSLTIRGIKKDEKLVRSLDRLR